MKAMILAAGYGTRLRPLTNKKPKALMPVANRPILSRNIEYLKRFGVGEILVNAHHHARQISDYLEAGRPFGLKVDVRVEPEILGTGGGIKNTEDFWDQGSFIVMNSDILTDIDLGPVYDHHSKSKAIATLVLHDREPYNQIQIDGHGAVVDIARARSPERLAFTGIHMIEPRLLDHIPSAGFSDIIDCYQELIRAGEFIAAYQSKGHYWHDIGTVASYVDVNREFLGQASTAAIGPGCQVDPTVRLDEWAVVGPNSRLEQGVEIRRSILWENVRVHAGVKVVDSIVTANQEVKRDLISEII
jgi:mannose-1-phosphate guanylyltransferase